MATYRYQGIRFRGTKFYFNPMHKIHDRFGELDQKVKVGFLHSSTFLKAAKHLRPNNCLFYHSIDLL